MMSDWTATHDFAELMDSIGSAAMKMFMNMGSYEVSFDVTNTGQRAGADVAQLYLSEEHPKIARPVQELKGFARVALDPGETHHVTIPLDARSVAWYDVKHKAWHADQGSFTVHVSRSSADPRLECKIYVAQPVNLPVEWTSRKLS
jgi:beta-glucosidase